MDNNHYVTRDTNLAAWLDSQGFDLLEVRKEAESCAFVFDNDNPKLMEYVRDFQLGRAEGNIMMFCRSRKKMLNKVKVAKL